MEDEVSKGIVGHGIYLALRHIFTCSIDVPSFSNLDRLGTRNNVPGRKILRVRSVSFHESLSFAVDEKSALSSTSFRHQTAGTIDSCQMEAIRAAFVILFPHTTICPLLLRYVSFTSSTLVQFSNQEQFQNPQTKHFYVMMSSFTHSFQVFLFLPLHLTLATSIFLQADTQSSTLLLSRCPNHFNLPCLTTSATLSKSVQIHTALSILQRHSTHPSHHHPLCPLQTMQIFSLHRPCFSPSHMSTNAGHKVCISFPLCGMMHFWACLISVLLLTL